MRRATVAVGGPSHHQAWSRTRALAGISLYSGRRLASSASQRQQNQIQIQSTEDHQQQAAVDGATRSASRSRKSSQQRTATAAAAGGRPREGMLNYAAFKKAVEGGEIDTVIVAFTDLTGRQLGKRYDAEYVLDHFHDFESHACDYLLTIGVDMNPLDGFKAANWSVTPQQHITILILILILFFFFSCDFFFFLFFLDISTRGHRGWQDDSNLWETWSLQAAWVW